ncbi:excalibur calcium-binding domain-containing protein [Shimia sp. R9_2]|uniref:excalibur calcium-binding domain-containing protein n=1 Tax=Shimia sp. R9_2 TaxID=2821112 RepID=UPI001ADAB1B1|nr:excalibur calcium-binding domain-containing protein [Shimia sp. R9_2]MBO9395699.1 excalibur calcium-binding domain-containing protein [Shimia sp. R9_2]
MTINRLNTRALLVLTIAQLIGIIAAAAQPCHPSYKGACLPPNGPDVDCAGGSGNGPIYVKGPIQVVGPDPYKLDRDKDGIACEK